MNRHTLNGMLQLRKENFAAQPREKAHVEGVAPPAVVLALMLLALFACLPVRSAGAGGPGEHAPDASGHVAPPGQTAVEQPLRVLPPGKLPDDRRLGPLKTLNDYFPFHPCTTPEQWSQRAERLRRRILVAAGLWPMPTRTPLRAVIHGRVDRPQYTVEKVYFESFPGHYVTGNLYRPKTGSTSEGRRGRPAVLCPHGHWSGGRFHDAGEEQVRKQIEQGAEKFPLGGRHPIQARCVQLARMGCVVFNYDMVGYGDSGQLEHRPGVREEMNTRENWGFFSPQAELHLQNMLGLQTYNSIRALDFLCSLPGVDPQRIGVTGASGGGTQTFLLCAVDPRPAVAFPAVMVSTAMQGGCTCENACYLRIGTSNVEIAALFAPKPLGLTAANDWTREMPQKGFPELKQHYRMLGVEENVSLTALLQFGHNYNYPSRAAMYAWMNKHLHLSCAEPIVEQDYQPLSREEMTVWNAEHPRPPGGPEHERALLRWWWRDAKRKLQALRPHDQRSLAEYRKLVGGALEVMIGREMPQPAAVRFVPRQHGAQQLGGFRLMAGLVEYPARQEQVPVAILLPARNTWNHEVVVWLHPAGKQGLLEGGGRLRPAVRRLLSAGRAVVGVDLFGQGEFTSDGKPIASARLNGWKPKGPLPYAGYTFGYNHPIFAKRVHDVLSVVAMLRVGLKGCGTVRKIDVVGLEGAGHWVAAARAVAGRAIDRAAIHTAGFRFAQLERFDHPDFLPGAAKYGDLPGILALSAPCPLWLSGEKAENLGLVAAAYQAAGARKELTLVGPIDQPERAAVDWLLKNATEKRAAQSSSEKD